MVSQKRPRLSRKDEEIKGSEEVPFEKLPSDLVISILAKLCASASRPSDFINALRVCKRFHKLGRTQPVLSQASAGVFAMTAKNWSDSANRFVRLCVYAGSLEASYFLGMVRFYCLQNRASGMSLMARAAMRSHAPALFSIAVIHFNGSGRSKNDKDLRAGVALCARAASLGHVGALRELGHCFQDGYGVKQNIAEGRKLLVHANVRELASVRPLVTLSSRPSRRIRAKKPKTTPRRTRKKQINVYRWGYNSLVSDFGYEVTPLDPHPANRFLADWFELKPNLGSGLKLCSYSGCGRPETRPLEFRRCSVCGEVFYCSRVCQALDWKLRHKVQCHPAPADHGIDVYPNGGGGGDNGVVVLYYHQDRNI